MKKAGAENIKAKMAGGATLFGTGDAASVGDQNTRSVKAILQEHEIPLVYQDTGGNVGRKITFSCRTGDMEVQNSGGMTMDVGENPITIDQVSYTGVIGSDVLSQGTHKIKVHKDYWRAVAPDLNSLAELQAADILYPFNQKL